MKRFLCTAILIITFPMLGVCGEMTSEVIAKGKGTVICTGGGGAKPLFNSDCKKTSISRVTISGGAIKYEITCTDGSNTKFQLACDAFAFEPKEVVF